MAENKKQQKKTAKEYEEMGRVMEEIVATGYSSEHRLYKISFLRGMTFGLGSIIGGTLLLAILLWILSLFTELPIVGRLAEVLRNSID